MLVASCSSLLKKGGGDDGGAEASAVEVAEAAAPVPAAAALASNEGDVARFPDETAIASELATFQRGFNVRESPPAGTVVAALPKGATVTKVASHGQNFLVVFDNPKAPGTKLMGWVQRDAFSAVIQDAGPLVCPAGEIALFGDSPFCGRLCTADANCPANQACKGKANKLAANGKAGDAVTVCTAFQQKDAGAIPPVPPPIPAVVDAGRVPPPPPPPPPAADVVLPVNGVCPATFLLSRKTGKCHRPCPAGPAGNDCKNVPKFCIRCDGIKVCGESQTQCR
jgi:hypothetical protein